MTLTNNQVNEQKSENKLRTLRQILCDMERYRQKARPPTKVNIKGAKSVLGIKEHQNRIKNYYETKRNVPNMKITNEKLMECEVICRNCTNKYKTIVKEMNANKNQLAQPSKLNVGQLQQVDLTKHRSGNLAIDIEYERLQQKYCPEFHLFGLSTQIRATAKPSVVKSKQNFKSKKPVQGKCLAHVKSQLRRKPVDKQAVLQQGDSKTGESNKNIKQQIGEETHGDSDKTLTPDQTSNDSLKDDSNNMKSKMEEFPNIDQYRVQFKSTQNPPTDIYNKMHPFSNRRALNKESKPNLSIKKTSKIMIHDCDCASNTPAIITQHGKHLYKNNSESQKNISLKMDNPQMDKIFYHHQESSNAKPSRDIFDRDEYFAQELREAIEQNGGTEDPTLNVKLASVIEKAIQQKMPWSKIRTIMDEVTQRKKDQILHLLQIQLLGRIFILCTVRTCNFSFLMSKLDQIMQNSQARFVPVLQHFSHCCVIEAIVPSKSLHLPFKQFQRFLELEAQSLKIKKIDIIDMSKGEVCVKCQPSSMPNIVKLMSEKGYQILASDYGFRANKQIVLDTLSGSQYRKFIHNLHALPDIETICDNVLY